MIYEWRNVRTGKVVDHDHWSEPPPLRGKWERVFSFGLTRMEGGASPARVSVRKKL